MRMKNENEAKAEDADELKMKMQMQTKMKLHALQLPMLLYRGVVVSRSSLLVGGEPFYPSMISTGRTPFPKLCQIVAAVMYMNNEQIDDG